jgi:hypothetical protein
MANYCKHYDTVKEYPDWCGLRVNFCPICHKFIRIWHNKRWNKSAQRPLPIDKEVRIL